MRKSGSNRGYQNRLSHFEARLKRGTLRNAPRKLDFNWAAWPSRSPEDVAAKLLCARQSVRRVLDDLEDRLTAYQSSENALDLPNLLSLKPMPLLVCFHLRTPLVQGLAGDLRGPWDYRIACPRSRTVLHLAPQLTRRTLFVCSAEQGATAVISVPRVAHRCIGQRRGTRVGRR